MSADDDKVAHIAYLIAQVPGWMMSGHGLQAGLRCGTAMSLAGSISDPDVRARALRLCNEHYGLAVSAAHAYQDSIAESRMAAYDEGYREGADAQFYGDKDF